MTEPMGMPRHATSVRRRIVIMQLQAKPARQRQAVACQARQRHGAFTSPPAAATPAGLPAAKASRNTYTAPIATQQRASLVSHLTSHPIICSIEKVPAIKQDGHCPRRQLAPCRRFLGRQRQSRCHFLPKGRAPA